MKIVKQSYEVLACPSYQEALRIVETAGRTCWKSEDKTAGDSAEPFIRGVIKRNHHCYDGETEILTVNGFIPFKNYQGEDVVVVNKDTTVKGIETPKSVIKYRYSGKTYTFPDLGTTVTENHRMFGHIVTKCTDRKHENFRWELFRCSDLCSSNSRTRYKTNGEKNFIVPTTCDYDGDVNPFGQLVGFWAGDGCIGRQGSQIKFHLKKQRKVQYLIQVCTKLGYTLEKQKSNNYVIKSRDIGKYFHTHFSKDGIKFIPRMFDQRMIAGIIDGLINSDGSICAGRSITFCSTSKYLIEWVESHGCLVGWSVFGKFTNNLHEKNKNRKQSWILRMNYHSKRSNYVFVNDCRKKEKRVVISQVKDVPVYCVEVSTGIIIVRGANGRIFLCGNSLLEHVGITVRFITNRGCSHELVRHRIGIVFHQESTRWVCYNNDDINFIQPYWITDKALTHVQTSIQAMKNGEYDCNLDINGKNYDVFVWLRTMEDCERHYKDLVNKGVPAQAARGVLPNDLKTELVATINFRELRHIFNLRVLGSTGTPHPDIKTLLLPLLKQLQTEYPAFFDDLVIPE